MNRALVWSAAGGVLLAAATGLVIATVEQPQGPAFIAGDKPVTEDQVRQKLAADGWTNVQILRRGRTTRRWRRRMVKRKRSPLIHKPDAFVGMTMTTISR